MNIDTEMLEAAFKCCTYALPRLIIFKAPTSYICCFFFIFIFHRLCYTENAYIFFTHRNPLGCSESDKSNQGFPKTELYRLRSPGTRSNLVPLYRCDQTWRKALRSACEWNRQSFVLLWQEA